MGRAHEVLLLLGIYRESVVARRQSDSFFNCKEPAFTKILQEILIKYYGLPKVKQSKGRPRKIQPAKETTAITTRRSPYPTSMNIDCEFIEKSSTGDSYPYEHKQGVH